MGIDYTWAMFTFPIVVLLTDLTVRMLNLVIARNVVLLAYLPAIFLSWYFADWRIALASGSAYVVSLLFDIFIFQKVREQYQNSWWLPPFISSIIAACIDTYIFYGAAFYKSSDAFMSENWISIATTDLVLKIIISIIIFLPLYGVFLNLIQKKLTN